MQLKFLEKRLEAKNTYSFIFEPQQQISWHPGQYIYVTLPKLNYEDEKGPTRHFTIANPQTESKNLTLTTRIRQESGYKKTLNEIEVGSIVDGKGPNGFFVFDEEIAGKNPQNIFLVGGIGITPIRAFIKYNIDKNLKSEMYVIYSNSDPEFVFKKDLDKWQGENENINIKYHDSSTGGHIDEKNLRDYLENWNLEALKCTFWIVGPPGFVTAIENILENWNIVEEKIKTEKFTGY